MATKKPIKVGIIGVGGIAQIAHLPILKQMDDVEVRIVCDYDRQKAGWVADRFQVPEFYRDPAIVIGQADLDAVLVLTPTHAHMALATAALRAGKHVLVEKPMARNAKESKRMVAAAQESDCHLMVAMNHRFRPDSIRLKQLIEAGDLGEIYKVRAGWLKKKGKWARPNWVTNLEIAGGGVLMDLGIQMLDLILWMLPDSNIQRVTATSHNLMLNKKVEDTLSAYFNLDNNIAFSLEVSWATPTENTNAFTYFYGTEGTATLNPLTLTKITGNEAVRVDTNQNLTPSELYQKSFELELEHFIHCIHHGTSPLSTGENAHKVMEIVEAIYRSADEGREIILGAY